MRWLLMGILLTLSLSCAKGFVGHRTAQGRCGYYDGVPQMPAPGVARQPVPAPAVTLAPAAPDEAGRSPLATDLLEACLTSQTCVYSYNPVTRDECLVVRAPDHGAVAGTP